MLHDTGTVCVYKLIIFNTVISPHSAGRSAHGPEGSRRYA